MPGDYSFSNIVTLGSLDYVITGDIQRQPANDFAVGLRMGAPSYDSREGAQFVNYNDFTGGFGVRAGDRRKFPDRGWMFRDVRTWDSAEDITLAPLLVETTLGAIVPTFTGSTPGAGWAVAPDSAAQTFTLFGAMGNKVFKTTGTAFTAITPGGGPASAQTFALVLHQNPTNLLDKSIYWATGSTTQLWKYNCLSQTWSQPNTGTTGYADDLIEFDNKLLKIYRGQVSISSDGGATWIGDDSDVTNFGGGFIRVPSNVNFAPFFIGTGLDAYGQVMPYCVSAGQLYALDIWTRQAVPVDIGLPSSITAGICWQDGEVVVTDGYYVKAYHPQRAVRDMGFNRDNGIETPSFIRSFQVVAGKWLVAHVDTGSTLNLFMWDGRGWHVITGSDAIFGPFGSWPVPGHRSMAFFNGASLFSPAQRLWVMAYGSSRPWVYYMDTDAFKNPQLNGSHNYAGGGSLPGWIKSPWFDGGFAEIDGTAIEFELNGVFSAGKTVTVQYRTDNDESAWTTLGTTSGTSVVQRMQFAAGKGIVFRNIQFQFLLARSSTTTNTPIIRSMVFKYVKVPRLRSTFAFTVDIEHTARRRGVSEETVLDALYALGDDNPLTDFGYTGEGTFYVLPTAIVRVDQIRQDGGSKTAQVRVTIEEPV